MAAHEPFPTLAMELVGFTMIWRLEPEPGGGALEFYSPLVLDHFLRPRNCGVLNGFDGSGRHELATGSPSFEIFLRVHEERILEASFQTKGCVASIAASSALTELVTGAAVAWARKLTPADLEQSLGGVSADRRFCLDGALAAFQRALDSAMGGP